MTCEQSLFSPYRLGNVELKNRYVMVAMGNGGMVTQENTFNQRAVEYYVARARGGAGLIITGTLYVENEIEQVVPGVMPCPIDHPGAFQMTASELCERVHAYDTKIFAQLTAGFGRVIKPHLLKTQPISASQTPHFWDPKLTCRPLTVEEIQTIVDKCGQTAKICQNAGFDGVEIHAVHEGYLLDQFAMSLFNQRTDEYGGDLKGRLKFACDIVKAIKRYCGPAFPVILRYSIKSYIKEPWQGGLPGEDFQELGRDIPEGLEAAELLRQAGYDGFDVDAGCYDSWYWAHPPMYFEPGLNRRFGKLLKKRLDVPVIVAGRMEDPQLAAEALAQGEADLIGVGRALLADPELINQIRRGEYSMSRPCLGCHEGCMNRLITAKPVSCAVNPACGREREYGLAPAVRPRRVAVIGGGPAGMEAARVLALRGHAPHLFERADRLGGSLLLAGVPSFKRDDIRLVRWYEAQLQALRVPVTLGQDGGEAMERQGGWDAVIFAVGASPRPLKLPGMAAEADTAADILTGRREAGEHPVIFGGGLVGCELALHLLQQNKRVVIVERLPDILSAGAPLPPMNQQMLRDLLLRHGATILTGTSVLQVQGGDVLCQTPEGERWIHGATALISAVGYQPRQELYRSYERGGLEVYQIGDCRRVRNIMGAIWDAYELARAL